MTSIKMTATMICILSAAPLAYALAANRARELFGSPRGMNMLNRGAAGVIPGGALAIAVQ